LPFLLGTERLKGSHSMSGYHSIELAYLSAVYTNLLNTKQALDLYFKPSTNNDFNGNVYGVYGTGQGAGVKGEDSDSGSEGYLGDGEYGGVCEHRRRDHPSPAR